MAKSGINKVVLLGRLGNDPEVKYLQNGDCVTTLSVATSESWTDKNTGEKKERTEWHRVIMWRKIAEVAGEYLRKGARVYIDGKLSTRKWTDNNGVDRYTTEVIADDMQVIDWPEKGESAQSHMPRHEPARTTAAPRPSSPGADFEDDLDIPF